MKLREYLRNELSVYFIPLVKKEACELCKTMDNLEVHHIKPFAEILQETLQELNVEHKENKEDYITSELNLIANIFLGKHLKYKYYTLCEQCHKDIHENRLSKIGNNHTLYFEKKKLELENKINECKIESKEKLTTYLKMFYDNKVRFEKNDFINQINNIIENLVSAEDLKSILIKLDNGHLRNKGLKQFNRLFEFLELPYYVNSKRFKIKGKLETKWLVLKIN